MDRRAFLGALSLLAAPLGVQAQPAGKVYRIGLLGAHTPSAQARSTAAFRAGLRDLGYIEAKNIVIEQRWAEGKLDRLTTLAAELVTLKVDVLVTSGGIPPALAAKAATATIPVVVSGVGDAVGVGLVARLARPGGNVTGLSDSVPEFYVKRLELLTVRRPSPALDASLFS